MEEFEYKIVREAVLYRLRRAIDRGNKKSFTKEEICELIDDFVDGKPILLWEEK